jgi:hypothetical protein
MKSKNRKTTGIKGLACRLENLDKRLCFSVSPTVSLAANVAIAEGTDSIRYVDIPVSLAQKPSRAATVQFSTLDGTAAAGKDYIATSGYLTFRPGQQTASIRLGVIGDKVQEADEIMQVVLSNPVGCQLGNRLAVVTIADDDSRLLSVAGPVGGSVDEGADAVYTLSLSRPVGDADVIVDYTTLAGTAAAGIDFTPSSGQLVFKKGESAKTVTVSALADGLLEPSETFRFQAVRALGATIQTPAMISTSIVDKTVPPPTGSWTIMVYMTGDNLNTYAKQDINEMEQALSDFGPSTTVRFSVCWDQYRNSSGVPSYATGGGVQPKWSSCGYSVLTADSNPEVIASRFDLSVGERDTGDPLTLQNFVSWSVQKAPAEHYALVMWGHGSGILGGSNPDYDSGGNGMSVSEMQTALRGNGSPAFPKVELVAYDNCLMGMAEVGYAIGAAASFASNAVFVGSEELVPGTGNDYSTAFSVLKAANSGSVTASQIAVSMVASYGSQYRNEPDKNDTLSGVSFASYPVLAIALKKLVAESQKLSAVPDSEKLGVTDAIQKATFQASQYGVDSGYPYRDLGQFTSALVEDARLPKSFRDAAAAVVQAVGSAVLSKTVDQRASTGISVYLPTSTTDPLSDTYKNDALDFCTATNWDVFAKWLASQWSTSSLPSKSAVATASIRAAGFDVARVFGMMAAVPAGNSSGSKPVDSGVRKSGDACILPPTSSVPAAGVLPSWLSSGVADASGHTGRYVPAMRSGGPPEGANMVGSAVARKPTGRPWGLDPARIQVN